MMLQRSSSALTAVCSLKRARFQSTSLPRRARTISAGQFARTTSAETATSTDNSKTCAVDFLAVAGIAVPESAITRSPELSIDGAVSIADKVEPMLHLLQQQGLSPKEIELMLLRCPRLFTYNAECRSAAVVELLASMGFTQQQVAAIIKRFPNLLGFDTKGHLIPHCHYLKSLGLSDEELHELILSRPHVLGTSIELVITYLRKWLRVERTHVGRLLWSYPLDYSVPRLMLPSQSAELQATLDEAEDSSSSSSSSAALDAGNQQQQPLIGSPERCTWFNPKTNGETDGDSNSGDSSSATDTS